MVGVYRLLCRVLKNWFTGTDNSNYELGRFLWFLATLAAIIYPGLAMWWKGQPFNVQEFCFGLAAILAAGGFGVAQKDIARSRFDGDGQQVTTVTVAPARTARSRRDPVEEGGD